MYVLRGAPFRQTHQNSARCNRAVTRAKTRSRLTRVCGSSSPGPGRVRARARVQAPVTAGRTASNPYFPTVEVDLCTDPARSLPLPAAVPEYHGCNSEALIASLASHRPQDGQNCTLDSQSGTLTSSPRHTSSSDANTLGLRHGLITSVAQRIGLTAHHRTSRIFATVHGSK